MDPWTEVHPYHGTRTRTQIVFYLSVSVLVPDRRPYGMKIWTKHRFICVRKFHVAILDTDENHLCSPDTDESVLCRLIVTP